MAPVQSRLVLALTIPAAALAIFLSLLWLKRTSKGHPPSPPDKKKTKHLPPPPTPTPTPVDLPHTSLDVSAATESKQLFHQVQSEKQVGEPLKEQAEIVCLQSSHVVEKLGCGELEVDSKKQEDSIPDVVGCGEDKVCDTGADTLQTIIVSKEETSTVDVSEQTVVAAKEELSESPPPPSLETKADSTESPVSDTAEQQVKPPDGNMMTEEVLSGQMVMGAEKSDLSEKLVNLELDTMKLGEVEVKERDSANHSPSEIMLASPSMSTFSDAHSEGSSDSGKGHSDGTTSPSRTPAGGSSVAGDPSPSIYEFVIPQIIVGRLIGRHGVFLNEIMRETHTSIFIKVHPETVKLKICAIEGSQQDIDKALEKIRKKFPLRRYPKLTLERVSFVPTQASQQLRAEDFHLQLIEGVNNDVILSSLLSPGQFFVQQQSHPSYPCLTPLTQALTQAYSTTDAPSLVSPVPDAICVCPSLGGWYRAQIVSVDQDTRHCEIKFVDYGGYLRVDASLLKQIRADFLMLPFQAVECALANVEPILESGWSEEARVFVHNITFGRILQAQIVSYMDSGVPLVNLYTGIDNQVVLVNAELVSNGYAQYRSVEDNSSVCCSEEQQDSGVEAAGSSNSSSVAVSSNSSSVAVSSNSVAVSSNSSSVAVSSNSSSIAVSSNSSNVAVSSNSVAVSSNSSNSAAVSSNSSNSAAVLKPSSDQVTWL